MLLPIFILVIVVTVGAGPKITGGTTTPIQHVVIIFQENNSFDHYFATYPKTITDSNGNVIFQPKPNSPTINGLNADLLTNNQNSAQPFLLTSVSTCDQDNAYTAEQEAYDKGAADEFVEFTEGTGCAVPYENMGYYDGSTVTALWNYAQNYAMSDNFYGTTFGPTLLGHLNLISGQTHGATPVTATSSVLNGTVLVNIDPTYDNYSTGDTISMSGKNMGDLLNAQNVTWGAFIGGFASPNTTHTCVAGSPTADYDPHYDPFQYYATTCNPSHLPPTSVSMIGHTDQANHQYDLSNLWQALEAHNLPAVCYVKAPVYQTGHPAKSTAICEQEFLVETINELEKSPEWDTMAIFIAYDDSDGWYDHQAPPVVNTSASSADPFTFESSNPAMGGYEDRAGYGPRLPLLVLSPYAKENYVDHGITDQTSILRFVEDNWNLGRIGNYSFDALAGSLNPMFDFVDAPRADRLFLNPNTGRNGV